MGKEDAGANESTWPEAGEVKPQINADGR